MRRLALVSLALLFYGVAVAAGTENRSGVSALSVTGPGVAAVRHVGLSIIRTSKVTVPEALLFPGGSYSERVDSNFSAFLIKHGSSYLLFDTGLGSKVAEQYQQDMPYWARPFFRYDDPVLTAQQQLSGAGIGPIQHILLSHSHWDHASGIGDFPQASVWVPAEEREVLRHPTTGAGGTWASQISARTIKWKTFAFKPVAYEGFKESFDFFQDGSVVLVPLFGHTPGSVGLFITVDSGQRYFLVGDAVWSARALKKGQPKFFPASLIVDNDAEATQATIDQMQALMARRLDIVVVPAHDGVVQNAITYFPAWAK